MTKLSVNVNKIALLRNQRPLNLPSVLDMSRICLAAGAVGITVHPRPDERHIRRSDCYELADMLKGYKDAEFNIEGYPDDRYMAILRDIKPTQATLVPDAPNQATSDHGWDLKADAQMLRPIVRELKAMGIRVSLFMDPAPEAMALAKELGADRVELYTEPYATAFAAGKLHPTLDHYQAAGNAARQAGLTLNAGHDLNLKNLATILTNVPGILEVSIGHALIAEALEMGLAETVRQYVKICGEGK